MLLPQDARSNQFFFFSPVVGSPTPGTHATRAPHLHYRHHCPPTPRVAVAAAGANTMPPTCLPLPQRRHLRLPLGISALPRWTPPPRQHASTTTTTTSRAGHTPHRRVCRHIAGTAGALPSTRRARCVLAARCAATPHTPTPTPHPHPHPSRMQAYRRHHLACPYYRLPCA